MYFLVKRREKDIEIYINYIFYIGEESRILLTVVHPY